MTTQQTEAEIANGATGQDDAGDLFVYNEGQWWYIPPRPDGWFNAWPPMRLESQDEADARGGGDSVPRQMTVDWDRLQTEYQKQVKADADRAKAEQDEAQRVADAEAAAAAMPQQWGGPTGEADAHRAALDVGLLPGEFSVFLDPQTKQWDYRMEASSGGQRYSTFDSAQRNAPPGFRPAPIEMNDGSTLWGFERVPDSPADQERTFSSWDDLIIDTFVKQGRDAALQVDHIRDLVEAPDQRLSFRDALSFGMQAASIGGSFDAEVFKQIVSLVTQVPPSAMSDPFASQVQGAANAFEEAVNDPMRFAEQPPDVQDAIRRGMASARANEVIFEHGPYDDAREQDRAFSDTFDAELERLEGEQDPGLGAFGVPTREEFEAGITPPTEPFSGIEFGEEDLGGGMTRTVSGQHFRDTGFGSPDLGEPFTRVETEKRNRTGRVTVRGNIEQADPSFVRAAQSGTLREERRRPRMPATPATQPPSDPLDPYYKAADIAEASVKNKERTSRRRRQAGAATVVG
jgi:hypothetical protein